jgi:hypothetical protein
VGVERRTEGCREERKEKRKGRRRNGGKKR